MLTISKSSFIISLIRSDWILLIAIIARLASSITADISFLILALYALRGNQEVIKALIFLWLFNLFNQGIAPIPEYGHVGRYAVIFSSFISIILRINFSLKKIDNLIFLTVAIGFYFIVHAILFSQIPSVSILKAINWTLTISILLVAWSRLDSLQFENMQKWFIGFLISITVISLITLFFPEVGYRDTGTSFQGIINHPLAFAPSMALLGAFVLGQLLEQKKPSWKLIFSLSFIFLLVFMSESRTSGIALFLASLICIGFIFLISRHNLESYSPAIKSKRLFSIGLILIFFFVIDSFYFNLVDYFITKSNQADVSGLIDAFLTSRSVLYEPMIANIIENPFTGIGFGIASDPQSMAITNDPIFGLPIQAPIEKGVTPLMVLEEVGLIGFLLFILWVFLLIIRSISNGIAAFLVLITLLLINVGESVLFSPGGAGLLIIIALSASVTKPRLIKYGRSGV